MPTLAEIDRGALNELDKPYCRWVLPGQPVVLAPMEWIAKDYRGAPKSNLLRDRVQICTTTWSHQCGEAIYNRSTGDWRCVKHGARCCPPGAINCAGLPTCQPTTADQHFVYIDDPSLGLAKQKADASGNPIWTKAEPLPAPPPITDWGTILMWFGGGIVAFLLFTRKKKD